MLPPITEIIHLSKNRNLQMEEITDWLAKYQFSYERINRINKALYLKEFDGELIRLPDFSKENKADDQFLEFFQKLTELKSYFLQEEYYKSQLDAFEKAGEDPILLKGLYDSNIKLYKDDIFSFYIDFVSDISLENIISVSLSWSNEGILINPENFKYTFEFNQEFENHFT